MSEDNAGKSILSGKGVKIEIERGTYERLLRIILIGENGLRTYSDVIDRALDVQDNAIETQIKATP